MRYAIIKITTNKIQDAILERIDMMNKQQNEMTLEQRNEILERFKKSQITPEQKQKLKDNIRTGRIIALAIDKPAGTDVIRNCKE